MTGFIYYGGSDSGGKHKFSISDSCEIEKTAARIIKEFYG
jgi:hypothetical protein